uniref:OTU domain-containing protein 4 n=1 Tax=Sinocyclocheilus grahami TaxID=75366 RepID=A0A672PFK7_SINGR
MELRAASADAQQQLAGDRTHESRMDEYLRSLGFYRKKVAKDGSCLFRAVAEQVLHCQGLHTQVRATCVDYLRLNRSTYELFIEGNFEKYLENLQDPQSWVGQVEITALAELYKHDFVIFQEPDQPPVNITENGFTKKVRLCFLNGNHYDSVYPQSFEKSAAMCQSILYELLYDRVCGVERSILGPCTKGGKGRDKLDSEECKSSEESDLEEDEFWYGFACVHETFSLTGSLVGRDLLSSKAQKSLNPALYRNVEYDVWLRSKRIQQQRDFCMAAGMQYSVGDKCKDSEESGQKSSSTIKEKVQEKPIPASPFPPPAVIVSSDPKKAPSSSPSESAKALGPNQSAPEAIKKTTIPPKASSARSPVSSQFAPVSTSAPSQSISVAGAVSVTTPATIQSMPAPKPTQPSSQTVPVPTVVLPIPNLNSQPTQTPSQISSVASQITPVQVPAAFPTQTTLALSGSVPRASVEPILSIQTAPPASISAPPSPAPELPSQPQQLPYPHVQWSQLLQDPVYPGFPKNEKGEVEPLPPYSFSQTGEDLPQDINILRFFFNLGVKAYSQPMFPPIVYLGALNQAYQMHLRGPPPSSDSPANPTVTSWQPENPSPPRNLSSIPDTSLDSHAPVAPVASGSGPVGPIELGAYNDHPVSIPMPLPPMAWPASSGLSTYAGSYPPVQFSAPPYPPPGNQMYPPTSVGYHRIQLPMPLEALNHGPHGRMDFLPFVPPTVDRGQGNGQRSVNPQFGSLQNTAGFPGSQPHLSGGDYKPLDIPVSVATMEPPPFSGHCPVAQPFQIGPLQGDMAGLTHLTNGNLGKQGGLFPKSLHAGLIAEDPSRSIHPYSPNDKWSVEEMEFHNVDLSTTQSFYSQSYRGGGRRGQDDRGGYRGRSHRGWKDYSGRGRQDDQSFYRNYMRRGAGPRVEMQLPYL